MSRLLPISALLLGIFSQAVLAQDAKSQPVARLITSLAPVTAKPATVTILEPNDIERRAFEQTNIARVKNGLPPLVWDADVCRMARIHSESMSRQGYFSHITPEGLRLRERARDAGILAIFGPRREHRVQSGLRRPRSICGRALDAVREASG